MAEKELETFSVAHYEIHLGDAEPLVTLVQQHLGRLATLQWLLCSLLLNLILISSWFNWLNRLNRSIDMPKGARHSGAPQGIFWRNSFFSFRLTILDLLDEKRNTSKCKPLIQYFLLVCRLCTSAVSSVASVAWHSSMATELNIQSWRCLPFSKN